MLFNSTSTIMQSKFSLVYKIILCLFIFIIIFTAIGFGTIYPTLRQMLKDLGELHLIRGTMDYVKHVFTGTLNMEIQGSNLTEYEELLSKFKVAKDIVQEYAAEVTVSFIVLFILIFMFCMSVSMIRYATVNILHTFMSCNGEYGFTSCFLGTLKRSIPFGFAYVGFSFIFYSITISISAGIGFLVSFYNQFVGFMITYLLVLFSLASKRALFAMWLPDMVVNNNKVMDSFVNSMRMTKETFLTCLGANFFIYLLFAVIGTIGTLLTFGVGAIVFVALGILLVQTYEFVLFYQKKNLKYYIDNQRVIDPTKKYKEAVLESFDINSEFIETINDDQKENEK